MAATKSRKKAAPRAVARSAGKKAVPKTTKAAQKREAAAAQKREAAKAAKAFALAKKTPTPISGTLDTDFALPDVLTAETNPQKQEVTFTNILTRKKFTVPMHLFGLFANGFNILMPGISPKRKAPEPAPLVPESIPMVTESPPRRPRGSLKAARLAAQHAPAAPSHKAEQAAPRKTDAPKSMPAWIAGEEDTIIEDGLTLKKGKTDSGHWGYQVTSKKKTFAWVDAPEEKKFVIRPAKGFAFKEIVSRNIIGAMSKLRVLADDLT